ncbi:M28 family peptidase [Pedosphaera parvula]|nr:M28 family peptidase [Pedosphaera parvula]
MEAISEQKLRTWVERISVPRHALLQPEANRECARWLVAQFQEWGYNVEIEGRYGNVVALPKTTAPEMTIVGAHYDSVSQSPGADDNASALAAMLGCAEVMSKFGPHEPVCYVAFNGEEDGMVGSTDFVKAFLQEVELRVNQAHILEMVGYASSAPVSQRLPTGLPIQLPDRGDFLGLLANKSSGTLMDSILLGAKTYLPEFSVMGLEVVPGAEQLFPVLARSDHLPFWKNNIPTVMWTDTAEFRNSNYHQKSDTPDTLNYEFLKRVTQLLVACVAQGS